MGKRAKKTGHGKKKKEESEKKFKLILHTPGDKESGVEDLYEGADSGMFIEKEDVQLIYNALKEYKPTAEEEALHLVLLESFEETLVVNYGEPYPDAN
jgi:hypothetical protein